MKNNDGSILEIVQTAWKRRKQLAIAAFVLPMTTGSSVVMFMPSVYRSTATVLVDRQQVPEAFVRPTVTSGLETRLQTISQEVFSRSSLEGIIKRFGLYSDIESKISSEDLLDRMRKDIHLEYRGVDRGGHRGTVAFAVSYRGRDRERVAQVANTLASLFVEENLKVRERQATGTAEFLKVQLDEVKARLDTQEKQVSAFKRRNLQELPQQLPMNMAMVERLDAQLRMNLDTQTRLSERREVIAKRLTEVGALTPMMAGREASPPIPGVSPLIVPPDPRLAELARLQHELRELRSRYSDKYPDVTRLRASIGILEQEMKDKPWKVEVPALPKGEAVEAKTESRSDARSGDPAQLAQLQNPYLMPLRQAHDELDAELRSLKAEEQRLRPAIALYVGRVQNTPKLEQEFKEVSRDYESTKELYATLTKRYEEAQLAESMEQRQKGEQFRILDPAIPAEAAVAPNRKGLLLLVLMGSGALSGGLVLAAERLRPTFHSVDALRAFTTVPVLLSIPGIVTARDLRRHRRQRRLATAGLVLAGLAIVGTSYFVTHGQDFIMSIITRVRG
jgi:polysaccharide chain length determinant protein (PEP-CTERM system associated)